MKEGAKKGGAISRCESGPGKAQQAAWRRVLREAAATPNTKRTQLLRGVCFEAEPALALAIRRDPIVGDELASVCWRHIGSAVWLNFCPRTTHRHRFRRVDLRRTLAHDRFRRRVYGRRSGRGRRYHRLTEGVAAARRWSWLKRQAIERA